MLLLGPCAGGGLAVTRTVASPVPPPSAPPAPPPAPSATRAEPVGPSREGGPAARLHVWVRDLHRVRVVHRVPPVAFAAVWPPDLDARWHHERFDAFATTDALLAQSRPGGGYHDADAVLPIAASEGFAGGAADLSTPETSLLSLFAGWVEADTTHHQRWSAWTRAHLPEGESWESVGPDAREALLALDPPVRDLSGVERLAQEVLTAWPDHPVGDDARLALVHVAATGDDAERAALLLRSIADPEVRTQAALVATLHSRYADPGPLLDAIAESEVDEPVDALTLSSWALDEAVRTADWGRAAAAATRQREALALACDGVPHPHHALSCEQRQYELRDVAARLAALDLVPATTWQEALTAEAWRCHLGASPHQGLSRAEVWWTGERWAFGAWDHATPATDCLSQLERTVPAPPGPVHVRLALEGPARN